MSQYLIRNSLDQSDPSQPFASYLLHQQKRITAIFSTPLIKMSYNDYLIKQNDSIVSIPLTDNSKHTEYEQIFKNKQIYEEQVRNFIGQDITNGGSYYFYNWISNDQFLCEVPKSGLRLLATLIFSYQYQKAQKLIQKWQKNLITQTLFIFFKGFINLIKIVENDQQLKNVFFNKKISFKKYLKTSIYNFPHSKLLLNQNSQSLQGILNSYSNIQQKISCIVSNITYLKKFLSYFPNTQSNDYYKLIFAFMSNTEDQIQSMNMYILLLNCRQLNLLDRLNFVQKLVPFQQRMQFVNDFKIISMGLTNLSNLLFFQSSEQEEIIRIIQNYLDQYGDLEAVAQVCLEYGSPSLNAFVDMYQQILVLSCQQKKAQALQRQKLKKLGPFCTKKTIKQQPTSPIFLNHVNFDIQKIQPITYKQHQDKICYVCFRKNQIGQNLFIECGRCKHGGHLNHLIKWYEESNNLCPKTDCSCYCV